MSVAIAQEFLRGFEKYRAFSAWSPSSWLGVSEQHGNAQKLLPGPVPPRGIPARQGPFGPLRQTDDEPGVDGNYSTEKPQRTVPANCN